MSARAKQNDHRRIAWRLSGRIAAAQVAAFIAVDVFLVVLILLYRLDPNTVEAMPFADENLVAAASWLRGFRYLDIVSLWVLVSVGIVQALLILGQAAELRKYIRELLEPLRELRVAADAFAGRGAGDAALRNIAEALKHVEAKDMSAHIAAESVSPELRPLLDAITDMLGRLEAAYAAQAKFVSDASHELRTPIAVIQGYANLLSRWGSEDPETLHESIEAIRTEADMMRQMVNQLLFLARGDSDTLQVKFECVDLVQVMDEVLREVRMIEEEECGGDAGLRHEIEARFPGSGVFVSADPALIKQLVRILADNSLKYTSAGGAIVMAVSAEPQTGRALIMIQDEGQGIPAVLLPRIFDRFVRADEARSRQTGGSGLGLSIAKQIAERHGGAVEVFSIEGVGSRFTVILPLLAGQGAAALPVPV